MIHSPSPVGPNGRGLSDATAAEAGQAADPYVQPREPSIGDAIAAIRDEMDVFDDWMDRYAFIIDLGKDLPAFPEGWMDERHRVPGCQSQVWLESTLRDDRLFFAGASDAAIVSGLVALLLRVYSGRPPEEIAATSPAFLEEMGLVKALSSNRGNGVMSMAAAIRTEAARHAR